MAVLINNFEITIFEKIINKILHLLKYVNQFFKLIKINFVFHSKCVLYNFDSFACLSVYQPVYIIPNIKFL